MKRYQRFHSIFIPSLGFFSLCLLLMVASCGESGTAVVAEETQQVRPNLPQVPKVSLPNTKITYEDGSYSVYGLRKQIRQTIDEEVRVKALVVQIFKQPECPEGRTCPQPTMPHLWLGDQMDARSAKRKLRLVGYANSQKEMDDAREAAKKGKNLSEEAVKHGLAPIVWDWQEGKTYVIKGRFTRASGAGFADSEGLLEYIEYRCIDCPVEEEEE